MALCFIVSIGTSIFRYVLYQTLSGNITNIKLNSIDFIINKYKQKNVDERLTPISLSYFIEQNQQEFINKKDQLIIEIFNYLLSNSDLPRKMSAEINSLHAYKEEILKQPYFSDGTTFDLFHTDSFIGYICAAILEKYLKYDEKKIIVKLTLIKDLTIDAKSMVDKGLYSYSRCLFQKINSYTEKQKFDKKDIKKFDKKDIKIIGTGGFKAQIPYTSLIYILYSGIEGYYYHQQFKNMISLPKIPILFIDTQAIIENKQLIIKAQSQLISPIELKSQWNNEVNKNYIGFLFDQEIINGELFYKLSTAGEIIHKTVEEVLASKKKNLKDINLNIKEFKQLSGQFFFKGMINEIKPNHPVLLLFTTGVSLFTQAIQNYFRNKNELSQNSPMRRIIDSYEDHKKNEKQPLPIIEYTLNRFKAWSVQTRNNSKPHLINELRAFIEKKQERNQIYESCAELNTLKRMIDKNYVSENHVRGCFLVSDTYIGGICGEALSEYSNDSYGRGKKHFFVHEIKNLGYNFESFKDKGLPNLIKDVIRFSIHPEIDVPDIRIAICATGGFKAETAYVTILGMILGKQVFYIHENQENLIHFPPFPVVLNYSKIIRYFDHLYNLKWGIDGNIYKNYEKIWEDNNDDLNMKLFVKEINNEYKLNDAGVIILEIILNHTNFNEIRMLTESFIKEKIESKDKQFNRDTPLHIDWRARSTGGAPPKPAEGSGVAPLEHFLLTILSRNYLKSVEYRVGGLETTPSRIAHSNSISAPKYRDNYRGGHVQVKFSTHSNTLTLTIKFNDLVRKYQDTLEAILKDKVEEILENYFRNIGHEVQIKLPSNFINNELIDRLIYFVNSEFQGGENYKRRRKC